MSTRSVWMHDPVQVVAQLYDGCNWRDSTDNHSEGLQVFWRKAWGVTYQRSKETGTPVPNLATWDEAMLLTHRDEVNAYRRMTHKELKALAHMMKDDYSEPLFCIVVAMCMTRLSGKEKS